MIGNLVGNALRFTRRGGRVEVRAAVDEAGHAAEISVIDTGIGIDPAFVPRVFDPFSQADQGLARTQGGLGLGLALTRGLTELHGGTITAHSDGSGRGASFVIRIPLREVRPTPLAPRVGRQLHAPAEHGLRVLVVEDQPDAAETLGELLEILGHRVQVASDGATALSAAREFHPDAVISDLGLPGELDGYGLARALRAEPSLRDVFLLALSGYADPEARRRSTQAGFDVHLAKPLDVRDLERALTAVDAR